MTPKMGWEGCLVVRLGMMISPCCVFRIAYCVRSIAEGRKGKGNKGSGENKETGKQGNKGNG